MNTQPTSCDSPRNRALRALLLALGSLFLLLGIIGIVVPVLPTTPFLILAAVCYARSSVRCYQWLVTNRVFGRYLDDYLHRRGIPWRVRASALAFTWVVIGVSAVLFVDRLWLRIFLLVIALAVTVHLVMLKNTKAKAGQQSADDPCDRYSCDDYPVQGGRPDGL